MRPRQRQQLHHVYQVARLADRYRRMDNLGTILPVCGKRCLTMARKWGVVVVDGEHVALTEFGYHLAKAETQADITDAIEVGALLRDMP